MTYRRHQLVTIAPEGWQALLEFRADLREPIVTDWVASGRPLIMRRACAHEQGLALGLPLPPSFGKRRIGITIGETYVVSTRPPPSLDEVWSTAPLHWKEALIVLRDEASRSGWEVRVFGSLAWQWLTGLPYLSDSSDLDLILDCRSAADILAQAEMLERVQAIAPIPIDAELVLADGSALNWREILSDQQELLLKSLSDVRLVSRSSFLRALQS